MKKILIIIMSIVLTISSTNMVFADDTATLTIDLNGGTLSNGIPDGWIDIGDGKYSKDYSINESVNITNEWSDYKPVKTDCEFDKWADDNWAYWDGFQITEDITVKALYKSYFYVIMDLVGGSISDDKVPSGWEKVPDHDDQYRKKFLEGTYYWNVSDEWSNAIPQYSLDDNIGFLKWDDNPDWFDLSADNSVIKAITDELLNVILDLKGGTFFAENVPTGWIKDASQDDKYIKKYVKGTSSWNIKNELENVVPQYSEASGVGFAGWKDPSWYNLSDDNSVIEANVGSLRIVTVDLNGGTTISVDSSWTQDLSEINKYTKKFPVGVSLGSINDDINSSFSIQEFDGSKYFTHTFNYDWSIWYLPDNDDTLFTAVYQDAISLRFNIPNNATVFLDDVQKDSSFTINVPKDAAGRCEDGILYISSNSPNIEYKIEVYGNAGYKLDNYTHNGTPVDSYISSLEDEDVLSANISEGAQKYPVWIDDTQLSEGNTTMFDGTVSYDQATRVLTLDGADIVFSSPIGIAFASNITINVASDSSITAVESGNSKCAISGKYDENGITSSQLPSNASSLKITGDGKLTINLNKTDGADFLYSICVEGIFANTVDLSTDLEIISGIVNNSAYNGAMFYGINTNLDNGITISEGKSLIVHVDKVTSLSGMPICDLIDGPLTIKDNSTVDLSVNYFSSTSKACFSSNTTLVDGTISISANPVGTLNLSQAASLMTIEGATSGAKVSDTSFTQAKSSTPLLLSTKGLVTVEGVSMKKTEFKSNETVEYSGSPTAKKKADSTDVTAQIDNWNYTYYKESEEGSGIWNKLSSTPTDEGSYKLVVEVVDSEYFGKLELPFTVIHAHNFSYTVNSEDASQIIAACSGADCEYNTTPLTLTLTAPSLENLVYNESAKEIGFADGEEDAWKTATGNDTPTIEYYLEDGVTKTNNSNSKSSGEGLAPVNAGTYKAKVTVDGKTAIISFTVSPKTYEIIEGNEIEWRKGDSTDLVITSKAPYSEFKCVKFDNSTMDIANYTVVEGSTKVTIDSNYLEALSIGSYSFEIVSTNGIARTTVKIVSKVTPSPGTKYIVPNTRAR